MMCTSPTISALPPAGPASSVSTAPLSSRMFAGFECTKFMPRPPSPTSTSPRPSFAPLLAIVMEVVQSLDLDRTTPRVYSGLGITLPDEYDARIYASSVISMVAKNPTAAACNSIPAAAAYNAPHMPSISTFDGPTDTITRSGLEACAEQAARARIIAAAELYLKDPDVDEEDTCITPTPSHMPFTPSDSSRDY